MDKKKLTYILFGIMAAMIAVIVIIAIVTGFGGGKMSYSKIENEMRKAAVSYFKNKENSLPQQNGASVSIDANTLATSKYMKPLSKLVKDGVNCTGKVVVTKNGEKYLYSPMLSCGDKYQTKTLVNVVTDANPIVTSGDGLYTIDNVRKFRGEYINNYVKLDGYLWRILDIDSEGYMRLLYVDKAKEEVYVWDDRYNIEKDDYVGINNYDVSRIKQTMEKLESGEVYITDKTKSNLAYRPICLGKRSSENLKLNITEECETTISNQLFGLPYAIDYIVSSIDPNCKTIDDQSCANYNYLMKSSLTSWTLNGQKEKGYRVFAVSRAGYTISNAASEKAVRPTIHLSNYTLFNGGTGTKEDPYTIK